MAETMYLHESRIIELMFEIPGNWVVSSEELLEFVRDRVNIVLERLEMPKMFDQEPGLISGWFYNQLNTVKVPDFFAGTQIQYRRNWDRFKLTFRPEVENVILEVRNQRRAHRNVRGPERRAAGAAET